MLTRPAVLLPSVAVAGIVGLLRARFDWPPEIDLARPYSAFYAWFLFGALRLWVYLAIAATALAALRGWPANIIEDGVSFDRAVRAGVVATTLFVPVVLGLALVVPGIVLAILWSQATFLIIDGKARLFDAAGSSQVLTRGFRLEILVIGLLAAVVLLGLHAAAPVLEALAHDAGAADMTVAIACTWPIQVLADTFGVAAASATYFELDRRVDWIDRIPVG